MFYTLISTDMLPCSKCSDLIQETIYEMIPVADRALLHKSVGLNLLLNPSSNDPAIYLLAVNHINLYFEESTPSTDELQNYADINVKAAKYAISSCSFEQGKLYRIMFLPLIEYAFTFTKPLLNY